MDTSAILTAMGKQQIHVLMDGEELGLCQVEAWAQIPTRLDLAGSLAPERVSTNGPQMPHRFVIEPRDGPRIVGTTTMFFTEQDSFGWPLLRLEAFFRTKESIYD